MLSLQQTNDILSILDRQLMLFVGTTIGETGLTDQEKKILSDSGIDYKTLYDESKDIVSLNYQLGLLSNILGDEAAKKMTGEELINYIQSGQHIPLNERERATIDSIKIQSLADIRSNRNKIFQDINNVVANVHGSHRANQEEFLREKIAQGTAKRQSIKTIAREIAKLTGDWSRNFGKSVAYISHTALNEGRAAALQRRYQNNEDAKMYFQVQPDACKICIDKYLKNGPGSEPRVFTLKDLLSNGTNIGKKQADWQATLGALHVHCHCLATEYIDGMEWNGTKFVLKSPKNPLKRSKIRVVINGQESFV